MDQCRYHFNGRIWAVLIIWIVVSCKPRHSCDYTYADAASHFCAEPVRKDWLAGGLEQGNVVFSKAGDSAVATGFYLDGFRNETWFYHIGDSVINIRWAHYQDKSLLFETNLFDHVDSIYRGDFVTGFKFITPPGIVRLLVSVNSPLKDSTPFTRYKELTLNEFKKIDREVLDWRQSTLNGVYGKINLIDAVVRGGPDSLRYLTLAFGMIGDDFIEFSVNSNRKQDIYRSFLFNAVLTNLFVNKKRFYMPFKGAYK